MPYLYFVVSRCTNNKHVLYAKFGYCKNEKDRMSSYNSHNPSYKYSIMYYDDKVCNNMPLDNYIYNKVLLRKSGPIVNFKHSEDGKRLTDWFIVDEIKAKSVTSYMNELECISDKKEYDIFAKKLLKIFMCEQINNVNYKSHVTEEHDSNASIDYVSKINEAADCDLDWDIVPSHDNKTFTLIPHTYICTVDEDLVHSEQKHSRFVVSRERVIAQCFSHDDHQRTITGTTSRRLRELFFPKEYKNCFTDFMQNIIDLCRSESLVRLDGYVWKTKIIKPWIYKRLVSYKDFINTRFKSNPVFIKNPGRFASVIKYMNNVDNASFPFMKRNADFIGFNNAVVNIITHEVFDETTWSNIAVPRHNIDGVFSWKNTNTPLFDSIVQYQLGHSDVYIYFLALIGRLFYRVNSFDDFSIVPLIKGNTGTGKSTVLTIIKHMFTPAAVGVLNSSITRGLENKHDKELLIAHDIGDCFTDRLSLDLFKQIVSGKDISITQKNGREINVSWNVPIFLCSSRHPFSSKTQGSISQSFAIFKFDKYVPQKNTTLEKRIIEAELPNIVAKCLKAYKSIVQQTGNKSFWDVCPKYFSENIGKTSNQTDYLYMFLTTFPFGDGGHFMKQQGEIMLLQNFKKKFFDYMQFRHPEVRYRWTSNYSIFNQLGYRVAVCNMCKGPGYHLAAAGCCSEYSYLNRNKRYIVENIIWIED